MEGEAAATLMELGAQFGFMAYLIMQNKTQAAGLKDMRDKYEALLERMLKAVEK